MITEDITSYPSIWVVVLKPYTQKFSGNTQQANTPSDQGIQYDIPQIDLVIVDLYPFEKTVASGASEQDIIEKIDIGGISHIRAAAKNLPMYYVFGQNDYQEPLIFLFRLKGTKP